MTCGTFSRIERTAAAVIFCAKCFGIGMYLFAFEQSTVTSREAGFFLRETCSLMEDISKIGFHWQVWQSE